MKSSIFILALAVTIASLAGAGKAEAFIIINEFLADPATGLAGDANNDDVRDSYDDEFIEIYNAGAEKIDISGWKLSDDAAVRHIFEPDLEIFPHDIFVVFGGGNPNLTAGRSFTASTGSLRLNNGGDTITLSDTGGQIIDFYTYGSEAGDDQSIVRSSEGSLSEWVKHSSLANADGKLFSPGYFINELEEIEKIDEANEIPSPSTNTVPEPATILYLTLGLCGLILVKKRKEVSSVLMVKFDKS